MQSADPSTSCTSSSSMGSPLGSSEVLWRVMSRISSTLPSDSPLKTVVFALGNFYRSEAVFGCLNGVVRTAAGYASGSKSNLEYKSLGDHAEVAFVGPSVVGKGSEVAEVKSEISPERLVDFRLSGENVLSPCEHWEGESSWAVCGCSTTPSHYG